MLRSTSRLFSSSNSTVETILRSPRSRQMRCAVQRIIRMVQGSRAGGLDSSPSTGIRKFNNVPIGKLLPGKKIATTNEVQTRFHVRETILSAIDTFRGGCDEEGGNCSIC